MTEDRSGRFQWKASDFEILTEFEVRYIQDNERRVYKTHAKNEEEARKNFTEKFGEAAKIHTVAEVE